MDRMNWNFKAANRSARLAERFSKRIPASVNLEISAAAAEAVAGVVALSAAVQLSGLADRIGMAQSTQVVQTKTLDYFFNLRNVHQVAFQPIVELSTGELYEYECLFRPNMPMLPQSISAIVQAAIDLVGAGYGALGVLALGPLVCFVLSLALFRGERSRGRRTGSPNTIPAA